MIFHAANMKVITSIYLNCRPDLRDEWLAGTEPDDAADAQVRQIPVLLLVSLSLTQPSLRHKNRHSVILLNSVSTDTCYDLVRRPTIGILDNNKRYGPGATASQQSPIHRRSGSISQIEGLHADPALSSLIRPLGTPNVADSDVFPPTRSHAPDPSIFLPYIPEDIAFEEEYEDYLSDLGWSDQQPSSDNTMSGAAGTSAWHRLPNFVSDIADGISDSESVGSIGDLGDENRIDPTRDDREVVDENVNNWEVNSNRQLAYDIPFLCFFFLMQHMSPKTMAALPKSPAGGRRSSSGTGLRPVLPFALDDENAIDEDEPESGHLGREPPSGQFPAGASVDEVEYAYGYVSLAPYCPNFLTCS